MAISIDKMRDNIAQYGCSVVHVAEEGELPPFAYSIGITQETEAPEVVVIGLKEPMAHSVINEYNRRLRDGEIFEAGKYYSGFLEGFDVFAEEVPLIAYDDYFGQCLKFYGGPNFKVLQLVYPTTSGVWPWSEEASEYFRNRQPILSKPSTPNLHTHNFVDKDWPFSSPVNTLTFVTAKVAQHGFPVLLVSHDDGGDWQFLDASTEEHGECVLLCFGCIYEKDRSLAEIADLPEGWGAWRKSVGAEWVREPNPPDTEVENS